MRGGNLGHLAMLVALCGLLSGAFLAFHYAPTFEAARDATAHVETLPLGGFLRSLHHWCGNLALVLAGLHAGRLLGQGGYRAPRHVLWVLGGCVALVLLGFAYTGYLLAGDERSLAGLRVLEGVAASTPLVGDALASTIRGGDAISSATLTRLYALHAIVLPAALVSLVAAFVARVRRLEGSFAPARKGVIAVLAILVICAVAFPPSLGPKADLAGEGASDARPEWFFLWINELLHRVPGSTFLVAGLLPAVLFGLAIALPFVRIPRPRAVAAAVVLAILGLTAASLARTPPEPPPAPAGTLTPLAVMEKFQCARCHRIDGAESEEDNGPPINRLQSPAVKELFTREFFRRKVGDPRKYWDGTAMTYTPTRLKPTAEELLALERWFYGE